MDVYVKLSQMSSKEFEACFIPLNCIERLNFVLQRRQEIAEISDVNVLLDLCLNGFFDAMLPIIKYGNKGDILKGFEAIYSPCSVSPHLQMCKEDEIKVLEFAAKNMYVADFMYNKVHFLTTISSKSRWIENVIFQNASDEVLEFLFDSVAKDKILISKVIGDVLLEKGSVLNIKRYVKKVRYLGVRQSYITITALRKLRARTDLDKEQKKELAYFLLNKLQFSAHTVYQMRKMELID